MGTGTDTSRPVSGRSNTIGGSTVDLLRWRAESLRTTAAMLDPIAAEAFERRARQLDQGVVLLEAVLQPRPDADLAGAEEARSRRIPSATPRTPVVTVA